MKPKGYRSPCETPTYRVWTAMRDRCERPNNKQYPDYGGRGITVCERWHVFANFLADMGERPPGLTIDRQNNDQGYCKENCHWATAKEQANNRRPRRASKLTPNQIKIIRSDSRTHREIAADFGICHTHVTRIKNHQTNRHV